MMPKLFKTSIAEFAHAEWDGKNTSGWEAFGDKLIVKPDHVNSQTKGGVELPDDIVDRMTMAAEAGIIISIGEDCFKYLSNGTLYTGRVPKVGERVSIGRYSGQQVMGTDEQRYRILNDNEVGAIALQEQR